MSDQPQHSAKQAKRRVAYDWRSPVDVEYLSSPNPYLTTDFHCIRQLLYLLLESTKEHNTIRLLNQTGYRGGLTGTYNGNFLMSLEENKK